MDTLSASFLLTIQQGSTGGPADPGAEAAAAAAGMVAILLTAFLVGLLLGVLINVVICLLLINGYKHVPAEHQKLSPGMIWLLLIPLFNLIWNFIVYQRIPDSFQSAFAAKGRTDVGDCGKSIGLWFSICAACSIVPCVNYIAGPAALVLLIIFLVKLYDLKGKLLAPAVSAAPPGAAPPTAS